jgi:hypothetical protein
MGKHFHLTRQIPVYRPRQQSAVAVGMLDETNIQRMGYIAFAALLLLAFAYLVQVNAFSTKGYEIHSLQVKISTLQEQNKKISIESSQLQSLNRIESAPQTATMVPVTQIGYIRTTALSRR